MLQTGPDAQVVPGQANLTAERRQVYHTMNEVTEMPTALTPNGLYACRIWCVQAEQASVNTVYYLITNNTGAAVMDTDLGLAVENAVAVLYKSVMSTDASYRGVQVTLTNPAAGTPVPATVFSNTLVGPGIGTQPDCPRQIAGLIEWTTNFSGRRYRGHLYFPFPTVAMVQTDGIPTTAFQTVMSNLGHALLNLNSIHNVGSTGFCTSALYLHHRPGKSPTPLATPITGIVAPAKFANQRRRGSYGRPNSSPI